MVLQAVEENINRKKKMKKLFDQKVHDHFKTEDMATRRKSHVKRHSRHQDEDEIVKECKHSSFSAFLTNPEEHLKYIVGVNYKKIPPHLKTTVSNVVIFYHKDDKKGVEELKNDLEKKTTVTLKDDNLLLVEDKAGIGCKFCFKEIGNKKPGYVSSCCCFIYITEKFVKESWPQLSQNKYFKDALYDSRGIVVPVLPQVKGKLGFQIPMGLNQLRPLNYYRKGDPIFESSLNGLLADKSKMKQKMEEALLVEQRKWVYYYLFPKEQSTYTNDSTESMSSGDEDVTSMQDSGFSSGGAGMNFRNQFSSGSASMNSRNTFPVASQEFCYSMPIRHGSLGDSYHPVSSEHEDLDPRSEPLSMTSLTLEPPLPSMTNRNVGQTLQSRGTYSQEHSLYDSMQQVPQGQPISLSSSAFPSYLSSVHSSSCNDNGPVPVNLDPHQFSPQSLASNISSRNLSNFSSPQNMSATRYQRNPPSYSSHSTYRSGELNSSGSEQHFSDSSSFQSGSSSHSRSPVSVDMDPDNFSMNRNNSNQPPVCTTNQLQPGSGQEQKCVYVINNPKYVQIGPQGVITTTTNNHEDAEEENETNSPVPTETESFLSQDGDVTRSETSCAVPNVQTTYPQSKDTRTKTQQVHNTQPNKILPKQDVTSTQPDGNVSTDLPTSNKGHEENGTSTANPRHKDPDLRYQLDYSSLKPSSDTSQENSISMDAASMNSHKSIKFSSVKQKPVAKIQPMSVVFQNTCTVEHNDSDDLFQNRYQNDLRAPGPRFDDDTTSLKQAIATQSSQAHDDNTEVKSVVGDETARKTVD